MTSLETLNGIRYITYLKLTGLENPTGPVFKTGLGSRSRIFFITFGAGAALEKKPGPGAYLKNRAYFFGYFFQFYISSLSGKNIFPTFTNSPKPVNEPMLELEPL